MRHKHEFEFNDEYDVITDTVTSLLARQPRTKDDTGGRGKTCRSLIYDAIVAINGIAISKANYDHIGFIPDVAVALHKLCLTVDGAIDADPILQEIFERVPARSRRSFWQWASTWILRPNRPAAPGQQHKEKIQMKLTPEPETKTTAVFSIRRMGFCSKCGKTLRPGQKAVVHELRYFHFECYDTLIDEAAG